MNYFYWYQEKYCRTFVGLRTGQTVAAAHITDVECHGDEHDKEDIVLRLQTVAGDEHRLTCTDSRIIYRLPDLNRMYLDHTGRLIRVSRNIQHQWRYGLRENMVSIERCVDGEWQRISTTSRFIDDLFKDRRTPTRDQLITPTLGVSGGNLFSPSDFLGWWRNSGLLLLEEQVVEYIKYLSKQGVTIHAYVKQSAESNSELPDLYGGGSGAGGSETSAWERLLAM